MTFRKLNEQEAQKFRAHARQGYKPFQNINGVWHPVYQAECVKMNREAASFVVELEEDKE